MLFRSANDEQQKDAGKKAALQNPNWSQVANLPAEWSGLYQKDCVIGGPEKDSFFTYRDHAKNTEYYFSYIIFPPALNKEAKADVYPITYQVWQNANWPTHYLLFANGGFSQVIIEDGWARGLHQTLDGKVWDINYHFDTKYKPTDVVRWGVDVNTQEDYGSRPPCDSKLAQPWQGQAFQVKSGGTLTLQEIMRTP